MIWGTAFRAVRTSERLLDEYAESRARLSAPSLAILNRAGVVGPSMR